MLSDRSRQRVKQVWLDLLERQRQIEEPLGQWRDTELGALAQDLLPLLEKYRGRPMGGSSGLPWYDNVPDPSGARQIASMLLDAMLEKVGPDIVGAYFARSTRYRPFDLKKFMRELGSVHGGKAVRDAAGAARMTGQLPTRSDELVYVWTEVSVRGELDPLTYGEHLCITKFDVFEKMSGRKWFLVPGRNGHKPFSGPRETLGRYYRRVEDSIRVDAYKTAAIEVWIQIKLAKLAHDDKSVPPASQRWPRPKH